MEADTYSNKDIVEFSNKTFINVQISLDNEGDPTIEKFGVEGIPVTFLVTPEGDRVARYLGYIGPEEYKAKLTKGVNAHKQLKELEPKLKEKPDDYELNRKATDLYADLLRYIQASATAKKAAAAAPDKKAKAEMLNKAIEAVQETDEPGKEPLDLAKQLDETDADGSLGFKDKAWVILAMGLAHDKDTDGAIKKFEEILTKWPDSDKADLVLAWLGSLYHEVKGDDAQAEKKLSTLIEKFPKSVYVARAKELIEHMKEHKK